MTRTESTSTASGLDTLTGRVVRPGEADYPAARVGWNLLFAHRPAVVVFAGEARDVANALDWARRREMAVRVRSGGHCLEGWSNVDDGMVIDVSEMKSVAVDAVSQTATVGAGLTQLEAVTALGRAGYLTATGTEAPWGSSGRPSAAASGC